MNKASTRFGGTGSRPSVTLVYRAHAHGRAGARPSKGFAVIGSVMLILMTAFASLAHAEDWTTTDGKLYKRVQVLRVHVDTVTILYADGSAEVPFAKLTPEVQEQLKEWNKANDKKIIGDPKPPKGNEQ